MSWWVLDFDFSNFPSGLQELVIFDLRLKFYVQKQPCSRPETSGEGRDGTKRFRAASEHITPKHITFLELVLVLLAIYMLLGVAFSAVPVVALPLLLLHRTPPPETDKSPEAPTHLKKLFTWELFAR